MRIKKSRIFIIFLLLIMSLGVFAGCTAKEVSKEDGSTKIEKKATYTFKANSGKEYVASLISGVPKCTYDPAGFAETDGIRSYTDKEQKLESQSGIVVSQYQGEIDWEQVKESGIDFAMIRLGYRGFGGNGTIELDEQFERNLEGAQVAGVETGVYFFSQAVSEEEAKEEAEFVLEQVADWQLTGTIAFHTRQVEKEESRTEKLTGEEYTRNCRVFCDRIKEAGYLPVIYTDLEWMAFTLQLDQLAEYDYWCVDYNENPQCPYEFAMWEYEKEGLIEGISGEVPQIMWIQNQEEAKARQQEAEAIAQTKDKEQVKEQDALLPSEDTENQMVAGGRIVVIDAGHQGQGDSSQEPIGPGASETKPRVSSGTSGAATGIGEYELNLNVALGLETELISRGYQVIMVRTTNDVNLSNAERAAIANEAEADVFLRIHANGSEDASIQGALTMCMTPSNPYNANLYDSSRRLSECVLNQFCQATGAVQRTIIETDTMSGINWCQVPVTILEMGYMSNPEEDLRLNSPDYQAQMIQGIANGIDEYCSGL